jgi:hypothetical protein
MAKSVKTLQEKIASHLGIDATKLVFNFKKVEGITQLDLVTTNPLHNQSFLFHSTRAIDQEEAVSKMLEYVQSNFHKEDSYTIQWVKLGENQLHTSYFRAVNIIEVLNKFFYDRDVNSYRIYSISLNPLS